MPAKGASWAKVIERIGLLILAGVALAISWLLVLRAFEWLLRNLSG